MTQSQRPEQLARFEVEKIGGIDETTVEVTPGVSVLAGKNATNRTSFLQAIRAALGSQAASLKGDADRGEARLSIGEATYDRELVRQNGTVAFAGEPYLDDPTLADLFAFLLEGNEARRAVARGEDLRELIMRPVDVDAIRAEIDRLEDHKAEINDELAEIADRKGELPDLERERNSLREEIQETREALEAKEEEIEASSADVEETREEKARMEAKLEELSETRSDLEQVRYDVDVTEESIASLKRERNEVREELEALPETPMGEHAELADEIDRLRREKESIDRSMRDLQSAIQFNEEMLESGSADVVAELAGEELGPGREKTNGGEVTDQLVEGDGMVCWTCGSEVTDDRIAGTLDALKSVRQSRLQESTSIEEQLDELTDRQREAERQQEKRSDLERRLRTIEDELDERREHLADLTDERESLTDEVEALESEVEELESEDFSEVLDLHREANQLEFELGTLESDLDDVTAKIEAIEAEIERESDLEAEREEVLDELEAQRTRIERIAAEAVEAFNTHMDAILDVLGYENLDRVWIERREETVRDGRRNVTTAVFELHVVRSTESGAAYEDTVAHLSESEREVTGLIFALAGYLVHDVHEAVPFMLLDSLEAIDAERIAALIEYFAEYADYLVVALLPEDAQALDDDYTRVRNV